MWHVALSFWQLQCYRQTVTWDAMAIFRFEDQKIIEEWVTRDELGMVLQSGLLETTYNKYQS
jgi:hypothetical protein